jgi:hypothetical protein
MSYQGERLFSARLLGEPDEKESGVKLVSTIGSFDGSHAMKTTAGEHLLNVRASGPWTITIEQPRPNNAPKTSHYTNTGKTATDFFELDKGLKRFDITHEGNRLFKVRLLDKTGAQVPRGRRVSEIGPYEGSTAIQVPKDDIYLLQIEADGFWSVKVEGLNLGGR